MQENQGSTNKVSVPVAIIIAGLLIAGAVYFSNSQKNQASTSNEDTQVATVQESLNEIKISPISNEDHVLGNPNAPVSIIVYTDTECPFCKSFHSTMNQVMEDYGESGNVAWVYRHFPIPQLHSKAIKEAEATECAAELGGEKAFWDYMDQLFLITPSNDGLNPAELPKIATEIGLNTQEFITCWESDKYNEKIEEGYNEAVQAGGRGTPYSVFVLRNKINTATENLIQNLSSSMPPDTFTISSDKKRIAMSGALPYNIVKQVIDSLLK